MDLWLAMPLWWQYGCVGVFGLIIGSFLNVVIHRLPLGGSVVKGRSRCPHCGRMIRWYDNIPAASFVWLWGKCRDCQKPISFRYPAIEIVTTIFSLITYWRFALPLPYLLYFLFFVAPLIAITVIDWDHMIIPDVISIPGIFVGLMVNVILAKGWSLTPVYFSLSGAVVGGGFLWLVATGYRLLRHHEGLGGGDIKLMAMVGAFLGWKAVVMVIFIGSLLGSIGGIAALMLSGKGLKSEIPFGPFLAVAAWLYLMIGETLLDWYINILLIKR